MQKAVETEWGWVRRGRSGRLRRLGPSVDRASLGRWGEWLALRHVRQLGWDVVARNWTTKRGEVDLIAYDRDDLVFVEVKTRRRSAAAPPETALDEGKLAKLEELAMEFQRRFELFGEPVRVDLIAVETPDLESFEIRHWKSA